jgi:hypothetical protein
MNSGMTQKTSPLGQNLPSSGGDGTLPATFAANTTPSHMTITDSLGSAVTIAVSINDHY